MADLFDEIFGIAMEADDLTSDLNKAVSNIQKIGSAKVTPKSMNNNRNETDNSGTDENEDSGTDDVTKDTDKAMSRLRGTDDENPDDNPDEDSQDDENTDNEDTGDDENLDDTDDPDNMTGDDDENLEEENPEDDEEKKNKIRLRKNMFTLYDILKNNLQTLADHDPPTIGEGSKIYFEIQDNLTQLKDLVFNMATTRIEKEPYYESVKNYMAAKKTYEICIEILDSYITDALAERDKEKGAKNKQEKKAIKTTK